MKPNVRILSLVAFMVSLVTSCVNEGLQEPQDAAALKMIRPLDEQKAAVEASMEELHDLQAALEERDVKLLGMEAVQQRVASLSQAKSLEEGTLAAFELQKRIASILGPAIATLDSETYESEFSASFDSLEKGIVKWIGENFTSLYPVALADAKAQVTMSEIDGTIAKQQLYVDALESDIKAGLKKDENPDELASLAASVQEAVAGAEKVGAETAALVAEVAKGYETAVKAILSDPTGYDAATLKELNQNAVAAMASSEVTIETLSERVANCESQLTAILQRLNALESEIGNFEELLGMVQSVTFMSEFSEDKAIAYYTMNVNGTADAQGRKPRTGESTMELKWIVRPASAAAALTTPSLWDNELKVFGYYAQAMTKATGDFFNYDITKVTADNTTGVVTVTVANSLSNEFYFKETGAKLALSLATGNTDLTSKFVEIVPKDKSGTVYVESLSISPESIEIDDNQTAKITAKILPENATNQGVVYASSNNDIVTVASDGTVTAEAVGTATITVTASGTDEWGKTLKTTCAVKINSSIKIMGAGYVEEGGKTELRVDSPNYIDSQYVSWEIGTFSSKDANGVPTGFNTSQTFASIDKNGTVSGLLMYYNTADTAKEYVPLMVKCTIAGAIPVVLYHEMRVVAVQPLGISISNLSDTDTQVTTKVGQGVGLYGTIMPTTVNSEYFKVSYLGASDGYFAASNVGATTVTLSVQPGGSAKYNYMYPKGKELSRNITVNVEPYYVKTLSLPATFEMNPDQTATLTPTFTSDVDGKAPTYQNLKWTSSNSSIVSINETTGEMSSLKEGTVTITATTSNANAVPSGQPQKSATCVVTVKTPVAPIAVGNYYYSDGTWGTSPNPSGKSVIGVIFSTANAVASDPKLLADYPYCTNGLVISTIEYSKAFGDYSYSDMNSSGIALHLDGSTLSRDIPNGYGLTKAYGKYRQTQGQYCDLFDTTTGLPATHNSAVAAPATASAWYIPSYYEMLMMYQSKDIVNSALNAVSADLLGDKNYIHATLWTSRWDGRNYDDCSSKFFDMSAGGWGGTYTKTDSLPVRVVLAF